MKTGNKPLQYGWEETAPVPEGSDVVGCARKETTSQTNRMERSTAVTFLVSEPTDMSSTPVSAIARMRSRPTFPDASSLALPAFKATASRSPSRSKLSNKTRSAPLSSAATGIDAEHVSLFEAPHTGSNYLLKEMVFRIGRKHASRLRVIALSAAIAIPLIILFISTSLPALFLAGIVHLGGMVVALYVLARDIPARTMRASLVVFLFIGMFTSIVYMIGFGVMNKLAITRGLLLAPVVASGVLMGSAIFRPSLEATYKKFCLSLLIFLAVAGLLRLTL